MSDYNNLIDQLHNKLWEYCDRVYNSKAPSNATYPYILFSMEIDEDKTNRTDFLLTVEITDNDTNTYEIETIMSKLLQSPKKNGLDHYIYADSNIGFSTSVSDMYHSEDEEGEEYLNIRVIEFLVSNVVFI